MIVPCGGNLIFSDHLDSIVNEAVKSPLDFAEYVAAHRPDMADQVYPLFAGDYALIVDGKTQVVRQKLTKMRHRELMSNRIRDFNKLMRPTVPRARSLNDSDLAFLRRRLEPLNTSGLFYEILFECTIAKKCGILVRLPEKSVSLFGELSGHRPWIRFEIDPVAYDAWVEERESFEVVLETSRFLVHRQPEQHDPAIWQLLRLKF
jgi:hypothetical protein